MIGPDETAAQADLKTHATAAVAADDPVIEEGTLLHVKTEALQQNSRLFGDGETLDTNRESWVRWDGETWNIDTRDSITVDRDTAPVISVNQSDPGGTYELPPRSSRWSTRSPRASGPSISK